MVFMVYRRQYHLLVRTRQALDLDAIALRGPHQGSCIIETCDCGRMADHGHCGVGATASECHVEGRHPTAVGVTLPCDRSRRPTAPIIHEPFNSMVAALTIDVDAREHCVDKLTHHAGRSLEGAVLVGGQLDLDDLLDARGPKLDGDADK